MAEHGEAAGPIGTLAAFALTVIGAVAAFWHGKSVTEKVEDLSEELCDTQVQMSAVASVAEERRVSGQRFEDRVVKLFDRVFEQLDELKAELAYQQKARPRKRPAKRKERV